MSGILRGSRKTTSETKTVFAAQLIRPGEWHVMKMPKPGRPGPSEALVRVHQVGICGTDIAGYLGKMPFFSYPRIPGHELGVEVMAVGSQVQHVRVGDLCSVEPYINCGVCFACRRGLTNCCEQNQTLGVHCDGGLRPEFLLPAGKLHPANGLTASQCALVETLAIGRHAVGRANIQPGMVTVVVGAGPIGLSAVVFAHLAGSSVIVLDPIAARLDFVERHFEIASENRIHVTNNEDSVRAVLLRTHHQGAEVVIDATGNAQAMSHSMNFCAFGGKLVYVGITQGELRFPHAPIMHRRELSLLASRNALPEDFRQIIENIRDGRISTDPWITHRASFADFTSKFESWTRPETGVVKAMVEIPG